MKVALVHDWLVSYRGGEKVLEVIGELFPEAPIYTLFYDPAGLPKSLQNKKIVTLGWPKCFIPFRKVLLPWLPFLIEMFDLNAFDLVISTSSCVAKGVLTGVHAKHICYIHSPMRYIWDERFTYAASLPKLPGLKLALHYLSSKLRMWDVVSAQRVDGFIANSCFVQKRVFTFYRRSSFVISPPLDPILFCLEPAISSSVMPSAMPFKYFLVAGAMVYYKRFDLAMGACRRLHLPLVVAGNGPMAKQLKMHASDKIHIKTKCLDKDWVDLLRGAEALIFPGVEDFGMIAIEAMACGTPVIAFKGGGALDYIQPYKNGLFFDEASEESLCGALLEFSKVTFHKEVIAQTVQKYHTEHFKSQFQGYVDRLLNTEKAPL